MNTEYQVMCPYCGEMIWQEFYPDDGWSQETVIDCEVCCNPILYRVYFDSDGEGNVSADRAQ